MQPKLVIGCNEIFLARFLNKTKVKRNVEVHLMEIVLKICSALCTTAVVLPFLALACLIVWLLLQSLPRQWHYNIFNNETMSFCCPRVPLPSMASTSALLLFPVLLVIMACSIFPRLAHDHFANYPNSDCSPLLCQTPLMLIPHPMPPLPMPQCTLTPHLKVHHINLHNRRKRCNHSPAMVTHTEWLNTSDTGSEAAVQNSH